MTFAEWSNSRTTGFFRDNGIGDIALDAFRAGVAHAKEEFEATRKNCVENAHNESYRTGKEFMAEQIKQAVEESINTWSKE